MKLYLYDQYYRSENVFFCKMEETSKKALGSRPMHDLEWIMFKTCATMIRKHCSISNWQLETYRGVCQITPKWNK